MFGGLEKASTQVTGNLPEKFVDKSAQYASLVVQSWCNIQPDQPVLIIGETVHRDFAELLKDESLARGASRVEMFLRDPFNDLERIQKEDIETLSRPDAKKVRISEEFAKTNGALLQLKGSAEPDLLAGEDVKKVLALDDAHKKDHEAMIKAASSQVINRCLFGLPTQSWAQKVFPHLAPADAYLHLRDAIYDVCCLNEADPMGTFQEEARALEYKCRYLQNLQLAGLHFSGPETDLFVPLSDRALWFAGSKNTLSGIPFFANVPIGEIFTAPDWRGVSGEVFITMPTMIYDQEVSGIRLKFVDGVVDKFSAEKGYEALKALIEGDEGTKKAGEIALVSMDSRVAKKKMLFLSTLFDEKGRCHLALGNAYKLNIKGGPDMTEEERALYGLNYSKKHHDLMISDSQTTVKGITSGKKIVPLMEHGLYV